MRVNHCGEVCAQALYQGQALSCDDAVVTRALAQAAGEETEHLAWTSQRVGELGGRETQRDARADASRTHTRAYW